MKIKLILSSIIIIVLTSTTAYARCVEQQEYKVLFKENTSVQAQRQLLKNSNITDEINEIGYYKIESVNINKIKRSSLIKSVEKSCKSSNVEIEKPLYNVQHASLLNNKGFGTFWDKQWDMKQVTNNGKSYMAYTATKKTSIAIVDSGIDPKHIELKDSILPGSKNFVPKGGYNNEEDETGEINDIKDKMGHGTAVAGQITAMKNMKGIAPGIGVRSYRVFGQKSAKAEWITKAIVQAAKDDNDIINLSFGQYLMKNGSFSDGTNDNIAFQAYQKAINYAYKKGSIVVSAAGNDTINTNSQKELYNHLNEILKDKFIKKSGKIYDVPNNFSKVVSVGGTDPDKNLSDFSNYGPKAFKITAPAGTTKSLNNLSLEKFIERKLYEKEWIFSTAPNNSYQYYYGNSFAAPKVSGGLALIIDKYNYHDKPNKAIRKLFSSSDVKNHYKYLNIYKALK
ncbi:S8 family peptidase [Bacillus subtilis]|nr:S8 family serine peptidase [Bacillus subtilis]WGD74036.1 S8 family serine peptidase [Bacillus subtilis]WGD90037.1 S8 family serine peptidase [Bacillus subtilis]